jgi:glycerophosphoryl diester phosphodiesterase
MSSLPKIIRRKWFRWFCVIALPTFAIAAFAFTRFNIPFAANAPLASLQAGLGIHAGLELADPEIIGHRGSALRNPENPDKPIGNTRNSIQAGIDAGVDWIEVDLRRTSDGKLVLFHDEAIHADTNADEGMVSELTLKQLKGAEISVDPPEEILTLEEFGAAFAKRLVERKIGLILDIKASGIRTKVLDWIEQSGMDPSRVVIFGEYAILLEYRESGCRLGYTFTWTGEGNPKRFLLDRSEIIRRLRKIDASFLVIPVMFCSENLINEAKKNGVSTWAYGSDDPRDWEKVRRLGVTGLIVDYPDEAAKLR